MKQKNKIKITKLYAEINILYDYIKNNCSPIKDNEINNYTYIKQYFSEIINNTVFKYICNNCGWIGNDLSLNDGYLICPKCYKDLNEEVKENNLKFKEIAK